VIDAARIDAALQGVLPWGALFAVGGRVRDDLRASLDGVPREAKDLDYVVVGLGLDDLVERLRRLGPAEVVGASFAVVKATVEGTTVDVALPRRERSTGIGHREFTVDWGPHVPLADDLARRDFRMNMLARNCTSGTLVDPYGGAADVRARRIDVLSADAFVEDPLRMLRACQFAARFDYSLTETTFAAMQSAAPLVASVSPERVRDELVKLLSAERPSLGFDVMRETGLLPFVLPELGEGIGIAQNVYHAFDVYRHSLATLDATPSDDVILRLAALFHDVGKPRTRSTEDGEDLAHFYRHELVGEMMAREALTRLRFPLEAIGRVASLVRHHMYAADPALEPKTLRRFVQRITPELLERQFALRAADIRGSGRPKRDDNNERFEARVREVVAAKPPLSVRDLAVSGNDILTLLAEARLYPAGSRGGPEVGQVLRDLLESVIDEPARNERSHLLTEARHVVARMGAEGNA
jgi:tRNA nucleotidyltransferase (CCA-adding enzyme)